MTRIEANQMIKNIRSGKIKPGELHQMDVDIERLSKDEAMMYSDIRTKQASLAQLTIEENAFIELLPMKYTIPIS